MSLKIIDSLPKGFLDAEPAEITKIISQPSIIHLRRGAFKGARLKQGFLKSPGGRGAEKARPLFVSMLLHGNEFSGLKILQRVLKNQGAGPEGWNPPEDLIVFAGNPQACAKGERRLKGQPDFNRIWSGGDSKEHGMARDVLQYARESNIRAAIDIHNNSGRNPLYGCFSGRGAEFVRLAQAFSENAVYFVKPDSVLSKAFSEIAPSVVIECGLPGSAPGIGAGSKFLEKIWLGGGAWRRGEIKISHIYHTFAKLCLEPDANVSFSGKFSPALSRDLSRDLSQNPAQNLSGNFPQGLSRDLSGALSPSLKGDGSSASGPKDSRAEPLAESSAGPLSRQRRGGGFGQAADLILAEDFEALNFRQIPAGAVLGKVGRPGKIRLIDERGGDIFDQVFSVSGSDLTVKSSFIPSMFTKNIKIAKSDCLGYAMRKIPLKDFLEK